MRREQRRGTLVAMTTTDQSGAFTPPPPTAPAPNRVLRRSRTDRVGAGVAGGLGEYFGVDPVLFRVLFATSAFFGGAGVLAYLVAWAAIPEEGTVHAPIDRFVSELRRRRVPVWLVAIVAGLALWGVAFSWWAPGHFFPVIVVAIVLVAILARRGRSTQRNGVRPPSDPQPPDTTPTVDLDKGAGDDTAAATRPGRSSGSPTWVSETRQWINESKAAGRRRRRRAMPVRIATFGTLVGTLAILAVVDAVTGIALPVYFWATVGIVGLGLLVGMMLRRTPWTAALLLVPACVGLVAFAGSHARLHDGFGAREWTPTSAAELHSRYRLAFGQATLDLRRVGRLDKPRTVHLTLAAGEARILVPATMNATVDANVHFGDLRLNGVDLIDNAGRERGGVNLNRTVFPPGTATGAALTIDVHVTDGRISIERSG
jgi:phage shock protein PspC (stress-responsive transcriptional regulator)